MNPLSLGMMAIGGLGSLGSGIFGGKQAKRAANVQQQAAMQALQAQMAMYGQTRSDLAPFRNTGGGAFGQLGSLYGIGGGPGIGGGQNSSPWQGFLNTPDYKFAFDQGLLALDRSAAARGTLQSGGYGKELEQFGQGLASQQFGNYFNRLLGMSQIGANAAAGQATANLGYANNISNLISGAGQAQASGLVGQSNSLTGAFNNLGLLGALGASSYRPTGTAV